MRQIQLLNKAHVEDVKAGSNFPTNLIVYDMRLLVDDNHKSATILEINIEKNSRSVGFKDDFEDFVKYASRLEYISWSGGRDASFLLKWHLKFGLSNCRLRVINSKKVDPFEYSGRIDISGNSVRFITDNNEK